MIRTRRWLRGPYLPILTVIALLALDYTSYRGVKAWKWPVVYWQMYRDKGPVEPAIGYRRFTVTHADGRVALADLSEPLPFLEKPYRIDAAVKRRMTSFLVILLRELKSVDPTIVGVTMEKRVWWYEDRSYEEHLRVDRPEWAYPVREVPAPAPGLRASLDGSLLVTGDFEDWGRRSGTPNAWALEGNWLGAGVELATGNRAALLTADADVPTRLTQAVTVPAGATRLRASALVLARAPGAELVIEAGPDRVARAAVPADGAWYRVEATLELATPADGVVVALRAASAGETYFDEVTLR